VQAGWGRVQNAQVYSQLYYLADVNSMHGAHHAHGALRLQQRLDVESCSAPMTIMMGTSTSTGTTMKTTRARHGVVGDESYELRIIKNQSCTGYLHH
jgi:hypothetical protein